jgi:hypothetical protein
LSSVQAPAVSNLLTALQDEVQAIYLIILPISTIPFNSNDCLQPETIHEVRVMVAFALPTHSSVSNPAGSRSLLQIQLSSSRIKGRLIFAQTEGVDSQVGIERTEDLAMAFLRASGVDHFTTMDLARSSAIEGYALHPRYAELIPDDTIDYKP